MATQEFRLPDLGEGLTESEVTEWLVKVGEKVTLNQVIAQVETAKAVVDLPSPCEGIVRELHVEPGAIVQVGEPLVTFDVARNESEAGLDEDAPEPNLVGYGAESDQRGTATRRRRSSTDTARDRTSSSSANAGGSVDSTTHLNNPIRVHAAPPVRKLAATMGIDLTTLLGSGPGGRVTRDDVNRVASSSAETTTGGSSEKHSSVDAEVVPVTGLRRATAQAMVRSAFTAPHVSMFIQADVTSTIELLNRLRESPRLHGERVTFLTAVARAVCLCLRDNGMLNARWNEESSNILRFRRVGLGIAAATARGLLVPVVRDAEAMTFGELARAINELVSAARAGTTPPDQLRGGTFTITNIGVFGVEGGTPILNPGEAGILAVGMVARRPWEHEGRIELRSVVTLSLSIDHRVIDGAEGAKFLADVAHLLSDPAAAFAL